MSSETRWADVADTLVKGIIHLAVVIVGCVTAVAIVWGLFISVSGGNGYEMQESRLAVQIEAIESANRMGTIDDDQTFALLTTLVNNHDPKTDSLDPKETGEYSPTLGDILAEYDLSGKIKVDKDKLKDTGQEETKSTFESKDSF